MPYTIEEEIELLISGIEGDSAQQRIRGLVRAKHRLQKSLDEQKAAHAKELDKMAGKLTQANKDHEKALGEARQSWQAEAETDLALSDLGIGSAFDRKALRDYHATLEDAGTVGEFAKKLSEDKEAREGLPQSIGALFGANGVKRRKTPNVDEGSGRRGDGPTMDDILDMSDEDFDKATGRA